MKKWTIVIEITDDAADHGNPSLSLDRNSIDSEFSAALDGRFDIYQSFQIMEIIEAPYGPQHPNGVFLDERHNTGRPRK